MSEKRELLFTVGDALFLLRQFSSKIRTLRFTMGTLTALFTLAILGSSVAFMFNHFQNEVLVSKFPFDVQVYSSNVKDEFQQEIALLKQETAIKEIFTYKVYENRNESGQCISVYTSERIWIRVSEHRWHTGLEKDQ